MLEGRNSSVRREEGVIFRENEAGVGAKKWEPIKTDSRCISSGTNWGIILIISCEAVGALRQDPSTCVIRQGHDYKRRPGCEERAAVRS